jgi:superfamily II DNA/RNA helicase
VQFFVLDEADRLMDNEDAIMKLFKRLPKAGAGLARLQVCLCALRLQGVKQLLRVLFISQRRPGSTVG